MTNDIPKQDEADIMAAEYVLGTLPHADRLAAETRMRRDAHFALAVERWQARLEPLNDSYVDAPLPNLLPQIEARLFGTLPKKSPFWKSWFAGAAVAATLGLAVLAFLPGQNVQPLTTLAAENTDLRYDVSQRGDDLRITRTAGPAAAAGQVHEVWLIVGNATPISLGLIDGAALTLATTGLAPGMVIAISLEPTGGSPTGTPTGPVLVTGVIS
jgi:anti-sigma-K factor RskA